MILTILLQLAVIVGVVLRFNEYFAIFYALSILTSIIVVILILNKRVNPAYKIAWIIPILILPIFGGLFYLYWGSGRTTRKVEKTMRPILRRYEEHLRQSETPTRRIVEIEKHAGIQSHYIQSCAGFPLYFNEGAEYLSGGEIKFKRLKEELRKAERFIFLEYFIIEEGIMWDSILEILIEKVADGVDVRVIYDDAGCLSKLPYRYDKQLNKMGIRCGVFHPLTAILSSKMNNRDHRKIVVIDGVTGFVGGINLADEYINEVERFGHWRDSAILIRGHAVRSLTAMFLMTWDYIMGSREEIQNYDPFEEPTVEFFQETGHTAGFVQPFGDSPLDNEPVGESVYLNLINKAQDYIYITTPYLVLDNEMLTALCLAAKGGVDVRIITPHQADKKIVHAVSRSYYRILMESGVRIYEYTPGFIHSKNLVSDDTYGTVGTINMDYRSLFLHFECAVWLYRCDCIADIKRDFLDAVDVSKEITLEEQGNIPYVKTLALSILRIFAPLM